MRDIASTLDAIEKQIVAGDLAGARTAIRRLRPSRVPRALKSRYANLARRAELPLVALNALAAVVHPTPGSAPQGTPEERIEYGFALAKLRLLRESLEVFGTVQSADHPQALLGQAATHFSGWNYAAAIPLLRQHLARKNVSPYERLIAEVNLAAALVATESPNEVDDLLTHLKAEAETQKSENLRGTLILLEAQQALARRDFATARRSLAEARKLLEPRGGRHALLWFKWTAILDLKEFGLTERTEATLATVEHAARTQGDWETERQLTAYRALESKDPLLLARVYYGTPHEGFRRWLDSRLKPSERTFSRYSADLGPNPISELSLEVALGKSPAPLEAMTLRALCADLFRPVRLLELHPLVYGDEDFDPIGSPDRLKFALKSLRKRLRETQSPLHVAANGEGYRLEATPAVRLWIPVSRESTEVDDATLVERLKSAGNALSSTQVAQSLGLTDRTARRFLARAVDQGLLVRSGEARATRYHFPLRRAG